MMKINNSAGSNLNTKSKSLGIQGVPSSLDNMLTGSIYATILDSIPAHLSIIIQALKANLSSGNICVLVTQMTAGVFLSRSEKLGVDFRQYIAQNRLYLFSQEGDYATNIFRYGVNRFLQEFDYFQVPKGSFFLFDRAETLFTMEDQNIAQTQAVEYQDWVRSKENTSLFLFLFLSEAEKIPQSILSCFSGIARVKQNQTGIELLVDFWYAQDRAIAAKVFPITLDSSGQIRVISDLSKHANSVYQTVSGDDDQNTVFYFGPDFETFSSSIQHPLQWVQAFSFVDLIHLSRNATKATIVISLNTHSDLEKTIKMVHYLRMSRGNSLKIIIRESDYSLRYLNELILLRFGANLIIHHHVVKKQLPLIWETLTGQTYSRGIKQDFDQTVSSISSSNHKGYVDLVTFCTESLSMFERGDMLDIPLTLIVASYPDHISSLDILSQINILRNGDIYSSDAKHCYFFIHACSEENIATTFSNITGGKHTSLFVKTRFISTRENIHATLRLLADSWSIALTPDVNIPVIQAKHSDRSLGIDRVVTAIRQTLPADLNANKKESDVDVELPRQTVEITPDKIAMRAPPAETSQQTPLEVLPKSKEKLGDLSVLMNQLSPQGKAIERV